jgi:H/ACA ribonucleoprotein complex subunit 4
MLSVFLENKLKKTLQRSFFVVDKEAGRTSHDEVWALKKILRSSFNEKIKVGHSGTLDPKVTGVLVCGLGQATRALEYLLLSEKVYIAEFLFHQEIEREEFEKTLKFFRGTINQLPPVRSAVKREWRQRNIYSLDILDYDIKKR